MNIYTKRFVLIKKWIVDPIAFEQRSGHIVSLNHICHL